MRYIEKKNSCEEFEAFVVKKKLEKYIEIYLKSKKNLDAPWRKLTNSRKGQVAKNVLHIHLWSEQKGLCIYCQQFIPKELNNPRKYSHIEHIKEKSKDAYPYLVFKYENLTVSCNGFDCGIEEPEIIEDFCGHKKGELGQKQEIQEESFLNPTEIADIENFFEYDFEGNIAANIERSQIDQEKAKYMIDILDLQNENLIQMRINQLDDLNQMSIDGFDIEEFLNETAEKLPAFFSMLKQFFP